MFLKEILQIGRTKLRFLFISRMFTYALLVLFVIALMSTTISVNTVPPGLIVKGREIYINFMPQNKQKNQGRPGSPVADHPTDHPFLEKIPGEHNRPILNESSLEFTSSIYRETLRMCPVGTDFVGRRYVPRMIRNVKEEQVSADNPLVQRGGVYKPRWCKAQHKVAIIIPCRDRLHHLLYLLKFLHPILQKQNLDYTVYIVEQAGKEVFNKGMIMNSAFLEITRTGHFDCVIFHDVDLVPEDDRISYACTSEGIEHMSVAVNEMKYKLPYSILIGGVLKFPVANFKRANGYSNLYWGWGSEDDDMYHRIRKNGLTLIRPSEKIARYTMIYHTKRHSLMRNLGLLRNSTARIDKDGLNTVKYKLISIKKKLIYTHILVDIGNMPTGNNPKVEKVKSTFSSLSTTITTTIKTITTTTNDTNSTTKEKT